MTIAKYDFSLKKKQKPYAYLLFEEAQGQEKTRTLWVRRGKYDRHTHDGRPRDGRPWGKKRRSRCPKGVNGRVKKARTRQTQPRQQHRQRQRTDA